MPSIDTTRPLFVLINSGPRSRASSHCRSEVRLHLNSDAVDRLSRSIENSSERLGCHVHDQTSLAIPILDRLHDIPVRRQFGAIRSTIVHRPLHLVEHENRRPSMMMDRLFVAFGSKVTSRTRRRSFSKITLWCFGAATTASNAGSQVDGSKSVRSSAM